ncbi:nitrate reductase molybdenum cofactor assembly chaperone [uncultured Porticoccus sp.]|uniref:nitrate reductase molybdenum cofactor assembly chaperone n=1 Tax=uncultured Porticoccus sp. TaxID=1256050 RepID=UPI00260B1727|nr:nitrate reductase molybdenum cofactor assembly chaperone [uncultured Porticoccus sp.]
MDILKIISRLMDYPSAKLQPLVAELESVITASREISPDMRQRLTALLHQIYDGDLMDAQECYTGLFDRGRALSLLLFEHVHGESRDRGQAMVDLLAVYRSQGFHIDVRELPDFIPLYLEFLAHRPDMEAREGLADVAHILGLLSARLKERGSPYDTLFDSLLMISGVPIDVEELRAKTASEQRDDTPEALDKIWEEEAVTFGAGGGDSCPSNTPQPPQRSPNDSVAIRWAN